MFGGDYDTSDCTGMHDYIHAVDLARGHLAALDALVNHDASFVVNLGTGQGYSVLDVVRSFEKALGKPAPYEIVARRSGDIAQRFADPAAADKLPGWRAQFDIEQMCADHWRWQSMNLRGFA
ncbi:UDP-glucose 4-epimerase [Paraburkholderia sp. GAS42]